MTLSRKATIYLASKMRGVPDYNSSLFAEYAAEIRGAGFTVLSPPELDQEIGEAGGIRDLFANSLNHLLMEADALCLLPGWRDSRGVAAEIALARAIDLPIVVWERPPSGYFRYWQEDEPDGPILQEALRLVSGDRNRSYGDANHDFTRIASAAEILLNLRLSPQQVAMLMIIVKLSRAGYRDRFDNARDIAGYAECLSQVIRAGHVKAVILSDQRDDLKDYGD